MSLQNLKDKRNGGSKLITANMTQLKTDDLIGKDLTIIDVDVCNTKNGQCGVILFKEYENAFYFAGAILTDLCVDLMSDSEAYEEMKSGACKINMFRQVSEAGRKYVTFKFV